MKKIIYTEFGIRSEMTDYHRIGEKLIGMKNGKPFIHGNEIRVNIGDDLNVVDEVTFYNEENEVINRSEVCLDTETRIGGLIINNKKEILLLKVTRNDEFFCFPGGHRRECETMEECLNREMIEETGIDISNYQSELLIEMHSDGFGPEKFFLINLNDDEIIFQDENPDDITSKLEIYNLNEIFSIQNIYPVEVINKLKTKL